jgi:mannose-6-phosphate isomerase-like protein (cupin superfamily)
MEFTFARCDRTTRREVVVFLKGAARLRFDDGEIEMKVDNVINIPARQRHRAE